jgi:hypothetical protein
LRHHGWAGLRLKVNLMRDELWFPGSNGA